MKKFLTNMALILAIMLNTVQYATVAYADGTNLNNQMSAGGGTGLEEGTKKVTAYLKGEGMTVVCIVIAIAAILSAVRGQVIGAVVMVVTIAGLILITNGLPGMVGK